jgi:hypothetical protein
VVQGAIHEQPAAVVHKDYNDRALGQGLGVVRSPFNVYTFLNVRGAVQMGFVAHELAVGRQVKVHGQRRRLVCISACLGSFCSFRRFEPRN